MSTLDDIARRIERSRKRHNYADAGVVICTDLPLAEAALSEARRQHMIAEGRRQLGMAAIATAEIIDTDQMAAARADYLASFAEAFILDAFDAGETTRDQLIARARRIREKTP